MVSINPENVNNIVKGAENSLKKKTLGGVSAESAKEAIQNVATGIKQLADNAIGAVQQELQAFKGKSAQEMAELTSRKDAVILGKDKQIADITENAKQQLKAAKAVKTGKPKTLSNGNVETVKVNKNGARMTTETTPDGKGIVKVTVETLDGDIRATKYNPTTNKPIKTFTNVNGDKTIEYTSAGAKIKDVNVKNTKVRPNVVSEDVKANGYGRDTIKRTYSDGSYDIVDYDNQKQIEKLSTKFNSAGKKIETTECTLISNDGKPLNFETKKFNPETGFVEESVLESANGSKSKVIYTKGKPTKKIEKTLQGLKREISAKVDKYGNVDASNPDMKYVYPKNSPIKESRIDFSSRFYANKETLKMKDGSTVTMEINSNYGPYNVTIHRKGESPVALEREQGREYLEKIGKVGYNQDENYYSNVL